MLVLLEDDAFCKLQICSGLVKKEIEVYVDIRVQVFHQLGTITIMKADV
jgi:hypothetical protein